MQFGIILPLAFIMFGNQGDASSILQLRDNAAAAQNKTYAFNVVKFEAKPMELSPDAFNRRMLRLTLRNGIRIAVAMDTETLVPIQCGFGEVKFAGVQIAKIDTSQIYCVWLGNGDLVAGRATLIEGLFPIVVIEIADLFQRRRPGFRTIGK